jgi:hypothetical protein
MLNRVVCVFAVTLAVSAAAQVIQAWKTQGGQLYFGDHPPPGSVKVNEYKESSRSARSGLEEAAADAKAKADNAFEAQAIRRRRQLEKDINEAADILASARQQLRRVQSFSRRRSLERRESEALVRVAESKRDFESLTEEVKRYNHGSPPASWSPTLNCRNCP